ncbi:DNA-binding protein [Novosphingobium terrae]|uniref:DNA-binding protein n=1 Tax=Novosphingobium terrae TaxID=2726189 RepID=UPI00197E4E74|nr:DNA-binding protein [Novosphingobium terrae]
MTDRIPLDPDLRAGFDETSNARRPKAELDAWWDKPFGLTLPDGRIQVRCLNGGATDRSSVLGIAENYDAACALAAEKQAAWVDLRRRPIPMLRDGKVVLVRGPARPHGKEEILATFASFEIAQEFLKESAL